VTEFFSLLGIGIAAFAATNIDDIFVLMMFFSTHSFHVREVVIGQYLGIGSLIAISTIGSILAFVIPLYVIGLMGLIPISIGIIRLIRIRGTDVVPEPQYSKKNSYLSFLSVAAVTFSNGGDNIGVYTPLFAKYNGTGEVTTLVLTFMIMTAGWCLIGYYLVNHPLISNRLRKTGHIILLFVLIGLGIYILVDSFVVL
jgi:cadmium resistance protein CadD (predicted permease)